MKSLLRSLACLVVVGLAIQLLGSLAGIPFSASVGAQGFSTDSPRLQQLLDDSGAHPRQRAIAAKILSQLDPSCLDRLQTFTVHYDRTMSRGLAGKGVVIVSGLVGDAEFEGLMLHELRGHYWDLTCLNGTSQSGKSAFRDGENPVYADDPSAEFYAISWVNEHDRRDEATSADFVTGYAHDADPFEDLAESMTYYLKFKKLFEQRAKKNAALAAKLAWLQKYVPDQVTASTTQKWNGKIPWDATKLAFAKSIRD